MSINLATMGMFNSCCISTVVVGGGGAPPYRQNKEQIPHVLVKSVGIKSKKITESIQVKLLDNHPGKTISEDLDYLKDLKGLIK